MPRPSVFTEQQQADILNYSSVCLELAMRRLEINAELRDPVCAGGQQVTHVRFNGQTLTIDEAAAVAARIGDALAEGFASLADILGEWARGMAAALAPAIRAAEAAGIDVDPHGQ